MENEFEVSDTELTVPAASIGHIHVRTKEKSRLTDGIRHPVKTRNATKEEMEQWKSSA